MTSLLVIFILVAIIGAIFYYNSKRTNSFGIKPGTGTWHNNIPTIELKEPVESTNFTATLSQVEDAIQDPTLVIEVSSVDTSQSNLPKKSGSKKLTKK